MNSNEFGKIIKHLRKEQHISQKQLGCLLKVSPQTVSFWETGQREPDMDMLVKLAVYFEVSTDYLLGLTD